MADMEAKIAEINLQYLTLCKCRDDYSPSMVEPELTAAIAALIAEEQKPLVEALQYTRLNLKLNGIELPHLTKLIDKALEEVK